MILGILLLGTLIESLLLYSIRKSRWRLILSLPILIGFLLVFLYLPTPYFLPEPKEDGVNCGMPVLAVTFIFWIYGIASTVCVGVVFFFTLTKSPDITSEGSSDH